MKHELDRYILMVITENDRHTCINRRQREKRAKYTAKNRVQKGIWKNKNTIAGYVVTDSVVTIF